MEFSFKYTVLFVLCIAISGCGQKLDVLPSCRVEANSQTSHQGKGACVLVLNDKLMALQNSSDKLQLAQGIASVNTSAQCSAHQAIYRDTGFNVKVGPVLAMQKNGTWLFSCAVNNGFDGSEKPFSPLYSLNTQIKKIVFVDPFETEPNEWENIDNLISTRDAYVRESNKTK